MAQQELTWTKAIDKILAESATPLHYREITERIIAQSLRASLGATPAATVNAQIAASIKRLGSDSPYLRVGRGTFALRRQGEQTVIAQTKLTPDVIDSEEIEPQYDIITSFGMFW